MSYTRNQLEIVENAQADFDEMLSQGKFEDAQALIDNLVEQGFENEAIFLHRALNRVEGGYTYEPIEDSEISFTTPEEDDEQVVGVFPEWTREGDEKFPNPTY